MVRVFRVDSWIVSVQVKSTIHEITRNNTSGLPSYHGTEDIIRLTA